MLFLLVKVLAPFFVGVTIAKADGKKVANAFANPDDTPPKKDATPIEQPSKTEPPAPKKDSNDDLLRSILEQSNDDDSPPVDPDDKKPPVDPSTPPVRPADPGNTRDSRISLARQLAQTLANNLEAEPSGRNARQITIDFQKAAGLPVDGIYGGAAAGAVEYYLGKKPPRPVTKSKAVIPYKPPF